MHPDTPVGIRSRSVKSVSSRVTPIGRPAVKSNSVRPRTTDAGGQPPVVGHQPATGGHPEAHLVDGRGAHGQIGVEAQSEGQVVVADVLGIGGDRQPVAPQPVLDLEPRANG